MEAEIHQDILIQRTTRGCGTRRKWKVGWAYELHAHHETRSGKFWL